MCDIFIPCFLCLLQKKCNIKYFLDSIYLIQFKNVSELRNQPRNANSSFRQRRSMFWCMRRTTKLKIRLRSQCQIQDRLVRASQTLIKNFPIGIGDMIKDQFGLFLFYRKLEKWGQSKKTFLNFNLQCGFCALRWNREFRVKTVSLTVKL